MMAEAGLGAQLNAAAQLEGAAEWQQANIAALPEQVSATDREAFEALPQAAVVGSGAMGRCIALALARVGKKVQIVDASGASLEAACRFITDYLQGQVAKGKLTEAQRDALLARFSFDERLERIAGAGLVIEAIPEVLELKQQVMGSIAALVAPHCILATNTSTLDLDAIAGVVPHPERVIGTHFFIPAHITRLLEIVPSRYTLTTVLDQMKAMALAMSKVFVVAGNCDGFIGNRLFDRFHQEAMYLLEEGATPSQVDQVLEAWGMAIGPFRALDMVGNDIPWQVRCQRQKTYPGILQPRIGDALCEQGHLGQKSGSGWYAYPAGERISKPNSAIEPLLVATSAELGKQRRIIGDDEILTRCLLALVNEGCAILREGFACGAEDIDLAYVNGYGFPASAGGPMFLAEQLGLDKVVKEMHRIQGFASHGAALLPPDDLLLRCAQRQGSLLAPRPS